MSNLRVHIEEIQLQVQALRQDGHCADSPVIYLETVFVENAVERMLKSLTEFHAEKLNED